MLYLNLCCGKNKFPECDNVDFNPEFEADLKFDIRTPFPLEDKKYDEVYLFHSIEHIEGKYHKPIFREIHRVLKDNGIFIISYPEFKHCAQFWIDNYRGMRDFWKDTIYGRQEGPLDYHVYPMDSDEVKEQLKEVGFKDIKHTTEPIDVFNSMIRCVKTEPLIGYEEVLQNDIDKTVAISIGLDDGFDFGDKLG